MSASPDTSSAGMPDPAGPLYERFESMRDYERTMNELIAGSHSAIRIFEKALGPAYNTPARHDCLRAFLRASPAHRLFVVLHETRSMERLCPRFTLLRQQFSHVIQVRVTPHWARHVSDPFVIFDACHYLHRFHYAHMRAARGLNHPEGVQQLLERFGELWDASTPARGASVMGL